MIVDQVERLGQYVFLGQHFAAAVAWVQRTDLQALTPGRHTIDGEHVFANVVERELTAMPDTWEMHRRYADIHLMVAGSETIHYLSIDRLPSQPPYDAEQDCAVLQGLQGLPVPLRAGDFLIALPQDVHLSNAPGPDGAYAKKIILKVELDG